MRAYTSWSTFFVFRFLIVPGRLTSGHYLKDHPLNTFCEHFHFVLVMNGGKL